MEAVKKISYKGMTIEIYHDENAESPDDCGNEDCFIIYSHRSFSVQVDGFDDEEINECWLKKENYKHSKFNNTTKKYEHSTYRIYPLFAYIHSGVALSIKRDYYPFTCNWDTSMSGFVLVKIQKAWTFRKSQSLKVAQSVVNEWNHYLSGEVYGYITKDKNNNDIDSCWGFYGDYDKSGIIDEAESVIDFEVNKIKKQWFKYLKVFIKHSVPLAVRQETLKEFKFQF